jgi:hypothetical protein
MDGNDFAKILVFLFVMAFTAVIFPQMDLSIAGLHASPLHPLLFMAEISFLCTEAVGLTYVIYSSVKRSR